MKKLLTSIAVAVACSTMMFGSVTAQQPQSTIDNFELTDHRLMAHELFYYRYAPAVVLMSYTESDSKPEAVELEALNATYKDRGVLFFMLDPIDNRAAVRSETIPVLMDENQLVTSALNITREGEAFVITPSNGRIVYRGNVNGAKVALDSVLQNQPVRTAFTSVNGTQITTLPRFQELSYSQDIAPILQEKCVTCHLSGGIGPFALDSYDVVKGYAPMIRETVRTRRMPPYFADPHIGTFKNNQGLTSEQTRKLVQWIEAGAPRGSGEDPLLANRGRTAPDWPEYLGQPDVIVDIPAFSVPATGIVEYQNQRVANPFTENTWLRAISIKPGDRRVLHHVVSNHVADRSLGSPTIPGGSVGSYTPGAEAQVIADGAGAPVPAGGQLNFQMHYTTFGQQTVDRTQVGFYVLKEQPEFIKRSIVIGDFALSIPAGEARHREVAYVTFPADAYLYTLYPHAHYRGMHVELKMIKPDGTEEMMLALPKYDFNWQRDYDPVEPILVKAGTRLVATWVYDNSPYNFANPDPTINVTWGEQSHEEMMYFRVNYRFVDETVTNIRNDLQQALQGSLQLGAVDDNLDGLLQKSELRGPIARLQSQFDNLDVDKNGGLDNNEFSRVNARGIARQQVEVPDL